MSIEHLAPGPSYTLYGVLGLDRARQLFGHNTRLAKCGNRYHPSDGSKFLHLSAEDALIIERPPFLLKNPSSDFDEYYDGAFGWE